MILILLLIQFEITHSQVTASGWIDSLFFTNIHFDFNCKKIYLAKENIKSITVCGLEYRYDNNGSMSYIDTTILQQNNYLKTGLLASYNNYTSNYYIFSEAYTYNNEGELIHVDVLRRNDILNEFDTLVIQLDKKVKRFYPTRTYKSGLLIDEERVRLSNDTLFYTEYNYELNDTVVNFFPFEHFGSIIIQYAILAKEDLQVTIQNKSIHVNQLQKGRISEYLYIGLDSNKTHITDVSHSIFEYDNKNRLSKIIRNEKPVALFNYKKNRLVEIKGFSETGLKEYEYRYYYVQW